MKFCSQCGKEVTVKVPENDNLPRFVCDNCDTIHYQNPKIVTGCIPEYGEQILLCKRAIEPRYGLWTLPAGFMENKETLPEAAMRETLEEANAKVSDLSLYAIYSIPHISQVYVMFRASMDDANYSAGIESLEVELYSEADIPWDELAFPVIVKTLRQYFRDRSANNGYPMHLADISKQDIINMTGKSSH
ncbi:MAG: NUDIX hydrolase [Thiohalomonadales bacterium]